MVLLRCLLLMSAVVAVLLMQSPTTEATLICSTFSWSSYCALTYTDQCSGYLYSLVNCLNNKTLSQVRTRITAAYPNILLLLESSIRTSVDRAISTYNFSVSFSTAVASGAFDDIIASALASVLTIDDIRAMVDSKVASSISTTNSDFSALLDRAISIALNPSNSVFQGMIDTSVANADFSSLIMSAVCNKIESGDSSITNLIDSAVSDSISDLNDPLMDLICTTIQAKIDAHNSAIQTSYQTSIDHSISLLTGHVKSAINNCCPPP